MLNTLHTLNMSLFGMVHTAIALLAVFAGIIALARHGEISTRTRAGGSYVLLTVATCISGLFIFHHGGFGPPHMLAILTLVVLAIAYAAQHRGAANGMSHYVYALGYSLTLYFHLIPALTETGTRVPIGNPAFSGPEDATLKALAGAGLLVYLVGASMQAIRLRRVNRQALSIQAAPLS